MSFSECRKLGVPKLLEKTANIIKQRGLAKGLRVDPHNGAVDLIAALAIAAGAKPQNLLSSVSILDIEIPAANEAVFFAAIDVLDALRPEPDTWADDPSISAIEVQNFLIEASMLIKPSSI
jgi:hypothetical protein